MPNDDPILCPVDFSEVSGYALRYAAELAGCSQDRLLALHAIWWEAPAYFTQARVDELRKEFRKAHGMAARTLGRFVESTLGASAREVETRMLEALPADAIRQVGDEAHAAFIVMGTHGRSGWNRWTLGSVAERVLRDCTVPVLTVRHAFDRPIRQILCPVSNTPESQQALAMAARLGACFDATVTALHVNEPHGASAIANLCAWVPAEQRARCQIHELVRKGNAAEEIIKLASEESNDLLVIGAARRRFFEGMVVGSTTLQAVRHAPCPVMTVGPALQLS